MKSVDLLSIITLAIGAILVYGTRYIAKLLKIETDSKKFVLIKLAGLLIALIGFFRILDIF
jgi:hypothetical protein